MKTKIVTHHRFFNLDEIAAIALLDKFMLNGEFDVIRTRDEKLLNKYKSDSNVFVLDVGSDYDASKLNFDHHQNIKETWDNGAQYSSCGLIWKWLKDQNKIKGLTNNQMSKFESSFIRKVDAQDNGVKAFPEMKFVAMSNRNHHDNAVIDKHFMRTLGLVRNHIDILIDNIELNVKDIYKTNQKVTPFFDYLVMSSLMKNYAFVDKPKMGTKDNVLSFTIEDKDKNTNTFGFNLNRNEFFDENTTIPIKGTMTEFAWNLIKSNKQVISQKMNEETIGLIEKRIVNPVIKGDIVPIDMAYIAMYEESNKTQKNAIDAMGGFVMNTFADIRNTLKNEKEIQKFINSSKDLGGIVLCKSNVKNAPAKIAELCPNKELMIIPRDNKSWKIQSVPHKKNAFLMPNEWRGLSKQKLKKIADNDKLIFCHKAGFMCMFEGSKEEVIEFTKKILDTKPKIKQKRSKNNTFRK